MKKPVILLLIAVSFLLTGCGYSKEEKKEMQKFETQASSNAISYIKNKYNINAEFVSVELIFENANPVIDFSPDPTGYATVKMKYNNYTFGVIISGKEKTIEGWDNYQFREIEKDILTYFKNIAKTDPIRYRIYFQDTNDNGDNGYINYIYDSSMINKIIEGKDFSIILEYLDNINLATLKENNTIKNLQRLLIIKYKSKTLFSNVKKPDVQIRGISILDVVWKDAYTYDEILYNEFGNSEYYKFNVKKIDNIYYDNFKKYGVSLSKTTIDSPKNWSADEQIYNAYAVSNSRDKLIIYIPKSEIKSKKSDHLILATECVLNFKKQYMQSELDSYLNGNYYSIDLHEDCDSNLKFSILKK